MPPSKREPSPDELAKELASEESGARKIHESADGSPEGSPRDCTAQEDTTAGGATGYDLRDTADREDVYAEETTGSGLNDLPKEAVLQVNHADMPRKRSLGYKRKVDKVKGT